MSQLDIRQLLAKRNVIENGSCLGVDYGGDIDEDDEAFFIDAWDSLPSIARDVKALSDLKDEYQKKLREFGEAAETALSDLECAELHCWCFTRAAMQRPECACANCGVWRLLAKSAPK